MSTIHIASFDGITDNTPKQLNPVDVDGLYRLLGNHREHSTWDDAKLFSVVKYKDGLTRKVENVEFVYGLVLDYDGTKTLEEIKNQHTGHSFLIYSTFSHGHSEKDGKALVGIQKERYRVVAPLAEKCPGERWSLWKKTIEYNFPGIDRSCSDPSRMFKAPSHETGYEYILEVHNGPLLNMFSLPTLKEMEDTSSDKYERIEYPDQIAVDRNSTLFSRGRSLWAQGLSKEAVAAALRAEWSVKGKGELDPGELDRIIDNVFRKEPGLSPEFQKDACDLTQLEKLYVFLEERGYVSHDTVRQKMNTSASRLSQLLKEDREGRHRIHIDIRPDGSRFMNIRMPSGLRRCKRLEGRTYKPSVFFPKEFHTLIGTDLKGFEPETFFVLAADTNHGKTQFLLNLALENAERGKKVFYVQHEEEDRRLKRNLARRFLGRLPVDDEETENTIAGITENLILYTVDGESNLDSFLEDLENDRPDLVVYDYLSQEHVKTTIAEQTSIINTIVQKIGNKLTAKGVPFFTAIQSPPFVTAEEDGRVRKWMFRANVGLVAYGPGIVDERRKTYTTTYMVRKNKQGGMLGGYIRVENDLDTFKVKRVWNATRDIETEKRGGRVVPPEEIPTTFNSSEKDTQGVPF